MNTCKKTLKVAGSEYSRKYTGTQLFLVNTLFKNATGFFHWLLHFCNSLKKITRGVFIDALYVRG